MNTIGYRAGIVAALIFLFSVASVPAANYGSITPSGVVPHSDNDETLGIPPLRWHTIYVSNISDGSTTIAVSNLAIQKAISHQDFINGNGSQSSWVVNHDLNSKLVFVQTFNAVTGKQVHMDVEITDSNNVTLSAPDPLGSGYRVMVNILAFR